MKPLVHRRSRKPNGFTLLEAVLSTMILTMSFLTLATFSNSTATLDRKYKTRSNILQTRSEIVGALSIPGNWSYTVAQAGAPYSSDDPTALMNPNLKCLRDGTACTPAPIEGYPLVLLGADGKIIFDSNKLNAGFTKEGEPCTTYGDTSTPNNRCIFRYNVSWSPVCPTVGPCTRPQITTQIILTSNGTSADTTTSALQSQLNMQMAMLIDQPITLPPVARGQVKYTNSTVEYSVPSDTTFTFNPLTAVTSPNVVEIVPFADQTTNMGATVKFINPTQLSYVPAPGYYGVDYFRYTVRDVVTQKKAMGTVTMRVMTPYTWTGLAGADNKSSNPKNFCGKAVNGLCDGSTFPSGGGNHYQLIFNNTCTNCDAVFDTVAGAASYTRAPYTYALNIQSLATAPTYGGTIKLANNAVMSNMNMGWNNTKQVNMLIQGGTVDASAIDSILVDAQIRGFDVTLSSPSRGQNDYGVKIAGNGKVIAPKNLYVRGSLYAPATNFVANSGNVWLQTMWNRNDMIYAPGTLFWNLNFGFNPDGTEFGDNVQYLVSSDLIVQNQLGVYPGDNNNVATNGRNPDTWVYVYPVPTIKVYGDVVLAGQGGSGCSWQEDPHSCYSSIIELAGAGNQLIKGAPVDGLIPHGPSGPGAPIAAPGGIPFNNIATVKIPTLPAIRINKPSGKVTMTGLVGVRGGFTVLSAPAYDFSASVLAFTSGWEPEVFSPGTATDYNYFLAIIGTNLSTGSSSFNVYGDFYHYLYNYAHIVGDSERSTKLKLYGNLFVNSATDHANLDQAIEVQFVGQLDQHINNQNPALDTSVIATHLLVNKPAGTVYLDNRIGTERDLIVQSGNLVASPGSTLYVVSGGWDGLTSYINAPATVFENLEFAHNTNLASDLQTKNLKIGWPGSNRGLDMSSHKISVQNDLTLQNGTGTSFSNKIIMNGAGNQKIILNDPSRFLWLDISVNKASGSVDYTGSGQLHDLCVANPMFTVDTSNSLQLNNLIHPLGPDSNYLTSTGATFTKVASLVGGCP